MWPVIRYTSAAFYRSAMLAAMVRGRGGGKQAPHASPSQGACRAGDLLCKLSVCDTSRHPEQSRRSGLLFKI